MGWKLPLLAAAAACLLGMARARAAESVEHGFLKRVYTDADGRPHKYVLFIPHSYDGSKPFPAILFLHGSGETGTDGQKQVKVGLGPAVRRRESSFRFIVVFPQSEKRTWQASSADAQRAIKILEKTQQEYKIDPDRVTSLACPWAGSEPGAWRRSTHSAGRPSCRSVAAAIQTPRRKSRISLVGVFTVVRTRSSRRIWSVA